MAIIFDANSYNLCRKNLIAISKLMFQTLIGKGHQAKTSKINQVEGVFKEGMLFSYHFYCSWLITLTMDALLISCDLQTLSNSCRFQKSKFVNINNGKRGNGFPEGCKGLNFTTLLP